MLKNEKLRLKLMKSMQFQVYEKYAFGPSAIKLFPSKVANITKKQKVAVVEI